MSEKEIFEDALTSLREAVESLESDELSLEAALEKFEVGVRSAVLCQRLLKEVEVRVEQLLQSKDGGFSITGFDES